MRRGWLRVRATLALVAAIWAPGAEAQPTPGPAFGDVPVRARAQWLLGPMNACASAPDLTRDVEDVLERPVFAVGDAPASVFVDVAVRDVEGPGDGWVLDVRTRSPGEPDGTRHLELGPMPCSEARRSLIEVLALGLDYRVPPPPAPPEPPAPDPEPPAGPPPRLQVAPGFGPLGSIGWGLVPGTGLAVGGELDLLSRGPAVPDWSIELAGLHWFEERVQASQNDNVAAARFSGWQARLGLCRLARLTGLFGVDGCLAGVIGQVRGRVRAVGSDDPEASKSFGARVLGGPSLAAGVWLGLGPVELRLRGTLLVNLGASGFNARCVTDDPGCSAGVFSVFSQQTLVPALELSVRWRIDS